MAKFKIGDKVIDKTRRYMGAAKIIDETDDEFVVKFDSGPRDMLDKEDAVAANSRVRSSNAVVAKALNACARNGGAENHIGKRFGNVEVSAWDFNGNRHFDFGLGSPSNEPSRAVGEVGSKEYAISKAEESLKRHRQNIADIEKGIAWLKTAK